MPRPNRQPTVAEVRAYMERQQERERNLGMQAAAPPPAPPPSPWRNPVGWDEIISAPEQAEEDPPLEEDIHPDDPDTPTAEELERDTV